MEHTEKTIMAAKTNPSGLPHHQPELLKERKVLSVELQKKKKSNNINQELPMPMAGSGTITGWNNTQQPLLSACSKT